MNRQGIIRKAREAGFGPAVEWPEVRPCFERFAALVAAEERQAILRTVPGDWGASYDAFKARAALPNDAPALMYAFAAGMAYAREECAKLCDAKSAEQDEWMAKAGADREQFSTAWGRQDTADVLAATFRAMGNEGGGG